jgi:CcmD family protein
MLIVLITWLGLAFYIFSVDRKIRIIEKKTLESMENED